MSTDPHNRIAAVQLEPPADAPQMSAEEMLRELQAAHNMQQNLLAMEIRLGRELQQKQGRTFDKIRDLHAETRDAMRDLAKPDPVQQAILEELRGMREQNKDISTLLQTLVDMFSNGHSAH